MRPTILHAPDGGDGPTATQPMSSAPSAEEEQRLRDALASGFPLLVWHDHEGAQCIFVLGAHGRLTIGRRADCNLVLDDRLVSRAHAALEPIAGDWALLDDGISHNGTFVNGEKIVSRRLVDGDRLRFGTIEMTYRRSPHKGSVPTVSGTSLAETRTVTDAQRAVLIALARPYSRRTPLAAPASNGAIAKEVRLSLDAVKGHLDVLCRRFEIADAGSAQRRVRLVECALQWGLISESDLA